MVDMGCWRRGNAVFHGLTAVAELKRYHGKAREEGMAVFLPGLPAVAELKPARAGPRRWRRCRFPRPHRRGRIEAIPPRKGEGGVEVVFHGLTAVAELKRSMSAMKLKGSETVFHGLTAVAELKPI